MRKHVLPPIRPAKTFPPLPTGQAYDDLVAEIAQRSASTDSTTVPVASPEPPQETESPARIILSSGADLLPQSGLRGALVWEPATSSLVFVHVDGGVPEDEVLSVDLLVHGFVAEPGNCFVKNWSEHAGVTASLSEQHLVRVVREVKVRTGPAVGTAHEVAPVLP